MNIESNINNISVNEISISPQTMEKTIEELKTEEGNLLLAVENLKKAKAEESANNPVDLTNFRSINGKLTASEAILKEVLAAIAYKEAEFSQSKTNYDAFDAALRQTGESAQADRLDARRKAA